jgi:hypothetical protein
MLRTDLLSLSAVAFALATTSWPAAGQTVATPPAPANLQVPAGNTAFLKGQAVGTQNYVCLPGAAGLAWTFQGPQATVFLTFRWFTGDVLQQIVTHFLSPNPAEAGTARPTWQSSIDTSAVWAKKIAESSDPGYVAPGAIPWFLLQAAGVQRGPAGGSILARTTYIQRVNTSGGTISSTSCTQAGSIQFVPYTAEYVFYQANESH